MGRCVLVLSGVMVVVCEVSSVMGACSGCMCAEGTWCDQCGSL